MEEAPILTIEQDGTPVPVERTVDSIMKLLQEGATVQVVAARLNIDPAKVLAVEEARTRASHTDEDNGTRLGRWLDNLDEIAELAHWQAKADPTPNHVYAYTAVVETARGVVGDIEGRRDNGKIRTDFDELVLRPFCEQLVGAMTDKMRETKAALLNVTATERHPEVTLQIDGVMRALGAAIKDSLADTRPALDKVLADKPKKQPSTAMMKPKKRG